MSDGSTVNRDAPVLVRTAGPVAEVRGDASFACAHLSAGTNQR